MKMITHEFFVALLLMLAFSATADAKTYKPVNEIPNDVPENDEEKKVWQVGIAHVEKVRGSDELVNNTELELYLEGVMTRLMGSMVDDIGMEVDVLVFKDTTVNAWAYPNGTVAVQTGLLAAMENEAQLAAIMGHEVSHFLNRHAYIQIKGKQTQSLIGKGLGALATIAVASETGRVDTSLLDSGQIWTDLVTSGYSRKLETAADEQGLEFMIAAGYPPDQAIPAFESMRIAEDDVVDVKKMWSSHPDIDARKKNLSKRIKKADADPSSFGLDSESYLRAVRVAALVNSQMQVRDRQYDVAIARLERYTQILNDDASGHYLLGEAYRKKNPEENFEIRIAAYQNSVAINENFAEPYRELGLAYRQQGQTEASREALSKYLSLAPSAADAPIISWYRDNLATATPLSAQ